MSTFSHGSTPERSVRHVNLKAERLRDAKGVGRAFAETGRNQFFDPVEDYPRFRGTSANDKVACWRLLRAMRDWSETTWRDPDRLLRSFHQDLFAELVSSPHGFTMMDAPEIHAAIDGYWEGVEVKIMEIFSVERMQRQEQMVCHP